MSQRRRARRHKTRKRSKLDPTPVTPVTPVKGQGTSSNDGPSVSSSVGGTNH